MSHTGSDPHSRESSENSPAKARMEEQDRMTKSRQWERCLAAGLVVEIFHRDFHGLGAWVSADAVEAFIKKLNEALEISVVVDVRKETGGI